MSLTFDSVFSSIVVLIGILLTSHVFLYIFRAPKPTGCQSIPGPSLNFINRLIMFIQIHFFYTVPEFADYWCQRYGDTVGVWMNGGYTIITCDANLTQEFLSGTNSTNFISRMGNDDGLKAIGMFQQGIIWNNNVPRWVIQKKAFQNGLTSEVRQKAFVVAAESTRNEILFIKETVRKNNVPTVDLLNSVRHITLAVTLDVALGINLDREKSQYLIDCIVGYFKAWEFFLLKPRYIWPLFPLRLIHHKNQVSKLQEEIRRLTSTLNPKATPFLNNLYSDNAALTNEEIHQCVLEMVLAGTDTSSVSLYYTMLFLIENKDIQNKLLDSSDESFLEAVLRESMRLMPVGPVIIRKALADCNMSEMNIKAGTNIVMNLARQNRHPKWFDDPLNFIPQRFQENKSLIERSAPMGLGPKSCVGQHLAMVEMKAILPELLSAFIYTKMKGSKSIMETETKWDVAQQPTTNEILTVFPRKKVILVGAHSVGKTTLARLIENRTNAVLIGETARTVMKELNINVKLIETDPQKSLELQAGIIKFQCKKEEEIKNEFTVIDRCAVDALVYAKTFCKEQWSGLLDLPETKKCIERYKNDDKYIIFFIEPHINCLKDDGIRMMPTNFDDWKAFSDKYKTIMNEFGINYHVLDEVDLDLRFSKVFQTIFEM